MPMFWVRRMMSGPSKGQRSLDEAYFESIAPPPFEDAS
jgi:hypothetical protein